MAKRVLYMFCGHIANFVIVSLPEMLNSYIISYFKRHYFLQDLHCGGNSKSHSSQCLQYLVDFFMYMGFFKFSNSISIKTVFKQHSNVIAVMKIPRVIDIYSTGKY